MPYRPQLKNLIELAETGSTNDHAKTLAREGCPDGTVVWAHAQTAGRGRQGNSWTSIPGNLFTSIVLRPPSGTQAGQLSFLAAVALAETLKELSPAGTISLKWPNDALLDGRKVAGILLETESGSAGWVVVGIGVNIAAAPEGAASLGGGAETGAVLEKLAARIMSLYDAWKREGFEPLRQAWLSHAQNVGGTINVRLPRETFSATFLGIDGSGALQVEMQDGSRRDISSGEVFAA